MAKNVKGICKHTHPCVCVCACVHANFVCSVLTLIVILGSHCEHCVLYILVLIHFRLVQRFVEIGRIIVLIGNANAYEFCDCISKKKEREKEEEREKKQE